MKKGRGHMTQSEEGTRALLLAHARQYPQAQIEDYMKFLFQSAFGCEHLASDRETAARYIRQEAESARPCAGPVIEPLDGPYVRAHLDLLSDGLTPETLAALFVCSAEHRREGRALLEEKLSVFIGMIGDGELPLGVDEARAEIDSWQAAGYPACHHSGAFRAAYAPAYRLIRADYAAALPVFCRIDRLLREKDRVLVAVDGCSAAGKSTLAELLKRVYDCNVFHMDDFFLRPEQRTAERYAEPGGNVDRERFAGEVLTPLCKGETVSYRRFDCGSMTIQPAQIVPPKRLNVVEGSYSLHPALRAAYDLTVFLAIDPERQVERIAARNGAEAVKMFTSRWIPLETAYHQAFHPDRTCDILIEA